MTEPTKSNTGAESLNDGATKTVARAIWYSATFLEERLAALRLLPAEFCNSAKTLRGRRLLRDWTFGVPDGKEALLKRLRCCGATENDFLRVLDLRPESLFPQPASEPPWASVLTEVFSRGVSEQIYSPLPDSHDEGDCTFLHLLAPLINKSFTDLRHEIRSHEERWRGAPFLPETMAGVLFEGLKGDLAWMVGRTVVLELHIAKQSGQFNPKGEEHIFRAFMSSLRDRDVTLDIMMHYPVLARLALVLLERWVERSLKFLERLSSDWPLICRNFSLDSADVLETIEVEGDPHRGARRVLLLRFRSGQRLVYKPRSLGVEQAFFSFTQWLNDRQLPLGLPKVQVLDRGSYGWMEYVEAAACGSEQEVQRFYRRAGALLAALYVLGATDMHFENLIASGEYPCVIDLETLFQVRPTFRAFEKAPPGIGGILDSVLSVGLLPVSSSSEDSNPGVDLSGFGARAGQLTPYKVPRFEAVGTSAGVRQR